MGHRRLCFPQFLRKMGARGPRSLPVRTPALAAFPLFFVLGSPVPSLSSRDSWEELPQASLFEAGPCPRCRKWPQYPPSRASVLVLTIVLFCDGGGEHMLSLPRPVSEGALTSPAWDPWLRSTPARDPAQVQMFTGSLLPIPALQPLGGPKGKSTRSVRHHHSRRLQSTCSF